MRLGERELREIYNGLCCLQISIREKQKRRAKYIVRIINRVERELNKRSYKKR